MVRSLDIVSMMTLNSTLVVWVQFAITILKNLSTYALFLKKRETFREFDGPGFRVKARHILIISLNIHTNLDEKS